MSLKKKPPQWPRRSVNVRVALVFGEHGLRKVVDAPCHIRQLSEGDAVIQTPYPDMVPDYFYIALDATEKNLVGCYASVRLGTYIHCIYTKEISSDMVARVVAESEAYSALNSLWGVEQPSASASN